MMKKTKGVEIFPNVDLYSASVYYMLGIPMDLNTPIFAVSRVAGWAAHIIEEKFTKNERVMGMGHAVYKTVDPRSQVLKELSKRLSGKINQPWYDITNKVEQTTKSLMKKAKNVEIFPNVDLYSASVYYMLGIPMDLNTPIFAVSRVAGWAAHIIEEKFAEAAPKPMLYRPKAVYVGKYAGPQGCEYIPIEKRTKK